MNPDQINVIKAEKYDEIKELFYGIDGYSIYSNDLLYYFETRISKLQELLEDWNDQHTQLWFLHWLFKCLWAKRER